MTHQTSINLYEVDHLMDAARNLLNMLMDLSDKMNTSEAGNSDFSWTGLISTNTLALRLAPRLVSRKRAASSETPTTSW